MIASRTLRILLAGAALAFAASLTASAAPSPVLPDFSGIWARERELWLQPVGDEGVGIPIEPVLVRGRERNNIYAGQSGNPILQPWAREIVQRNAESELAFKHVYTADDTCWPSGVPQGANRPDAMQFIQLKDRVLIIHQRDQQVRWIWLNQKHSAHPKPSWYGESVGHYEGDELVVDTIGQKQHKMSVVDPFGTPHTDKIHVVERYRTYNDPLGKGLEVVVTVEDEGAFTMPWKGFATFRPVRGRETLEEFVCAENNRTFDEGSTFGTIPEEKEPPF
jgi:hypothetical protein